MDLNFQGDQNVSLFVTDVNGNSDQADKNVTIRQFAQDVNFTWIPFKPLPDNDVNFFGSTNFDTNINNWYWGFPDGNIASTTLKDINKIFTSSGIKNTCLTVQNNWDLNKTTCFDVNVQLVLTVTFFDENNGSRLQPNVTVNGINKTGNVDVNGELILLIQKGQNIVIAFDVNYPQRTYIFDINGESNVDKNVALLPITLGNQIAFQFFFPNGIDTLTDANVTVDYNSWIISKTILDGAATGTIFLKTPDFNYDFLLNKAGIDYNYSGTIITTKKPLDLTNTSIEITPFDVQTSIVVFENFSNLSTDLVNKIYPDTETFYLFSVDGNADYFPTSKLIRTRGGKALEDYQPYLVPRDTTKGIEVTVYTINNQQDRGSLSNIRIEALTNIGNDTNVLVESKFSDGTGVALFHFELDRIYTLKFYDGNDLKISIQYVPSGPNIFAFIETGVTTDVGSFGTVQVQWYQSPGVLIAINNIINLSQILRPIATTIGTVTVTASQDGNSFSQEIFNINSSNDANLSYDLNVSGLDSLKPIIINLKIFNDLNELLLDINGTYTFSSSSIFPDSINYLRIGLGTLTTTIFSLIFGVILIWIIMKNRVGEPNNNWVVVPAIVFTGIFAFFQFIPFDAWIMASLFGISVAIWRIQN